MKFASVLAALVLSPCTAGAQEQIVRLQCDGTVDLYDANPPIRDMKVTGIYLEIRKGSIKVAGSTGWDGEFEIKRTDPASVFFVSPRNEEYFGSVNKYSGELQLNRMQNQSRLSAATRGVCRPAKPLF
ncbi:hypothetical protein [Bradyrhizobium liaoningense]